MHAFLGRSQVRIQLSEVMKPGRIVAGTRSICDNLRNCIPAFLESYKKGSKNAEDRANGEIQPSLERQNGSLVSAGNTGNSPFGCNICIPNLGSAKIVRGNGVVVTEVRAMEGFHSIDVPGATHWCQPIGDQPIGDTHFRPSGTHTSRYSTLGTARWGHTLSGTRRGHTLPATALRR